MSGLALYGLDYTLDPWIPVGASAQEQARILDDQAAGFVRRSGLEGKRFKVYDGYLRIVSVTNGGVGIKVYSADKTSGDGVVPAPTASSTRATGPAIWASTGPGRGSSGSAAPRSFWLRMTCNVPSRSSRPWLHRPARC
jgi:hypothetical protein